MIQHISITRGGRPRTMMMTRLARGCYAPVTQSSCRPRHNYRKSQSDDVFGCTQLVSGTYASQYCSTNSTPVDYIWYSGTYTTPG